MCVPCSGFGTAFGDWTTDGKKKSFFAPEDGWRILPQAIRAGLRHFDCAYVYRSHRMVGASLGAAFQQGVLTRDDVFVTTKIYHPENPGLFGKTFNMALPADQQKALVTEHAYNSLEELGLGYFDLLLVHWPGDFGSKDKAVNRQNRKAVWEAFEELYERGVAKAIGVSNWTEEHLAELEEDGVTVMPHVNQVEVSPYCQYSKLMNYCREKNITIEAYSPLGSTSGQVLKDPVVQGMAEKYGKNPGQIVLKWLVQQGIVVLPRSSSEKRMVSNMDIFDFAISEPDMASISALNKQTDDGGNSMTNASPYSFP